MSKTRYAVTVSALVIVVVNLAFFQRLSNVFAGWLPATTTMGLQTYDDANRQQQQQQQQQPSDSQYYSLAQEQSFGFFDDITDENWMLLQQYHAKQFPNHQPNLRQYANAATSKGKISELKKSSWWNGQNFHPEFLGCMNQQRIPVSTGEMDGPKWVCDPHRIAKADSCLIYSVGSNGNAMFERGVKDDIAQHCEIHTFDLISERKRPRRETIVFEDVLKPYSTFHPWGLGSPEEAEEARKQGRNNIKTLQETIEELGHVGRRIDIFKIDCEWCEWFTYQSWLEADVDLGQILVETHNAPMPNARDFFYNLHDEGYVIFSKEANYPNGAGGVEFGFLKLSTSFFVNGTTYNTTQEPTHNRSSRRNQMGF